MSYEFQTESNALKNSTAFRSIKKELLTVIREASSKLKGVIAGPSSPEAREKYLKLIYDIGQERGRDLYFPFLGSGLGSGPLVELLDGSVKYDMITGIGINFFGHTHSALIEEMVDALPCDIMQGNLEPGVEMKDLLSAILTRVGSGCRLNHGWITCSGTMANEIGLKIARQKKSPATQIVAFSDCFAGRSTTMQEITDNPGYRQGQPLYGEVHYLPFFNPQLGLDASVSITLETLNITLKRYPGKVAALMIELIQGEGGFQSAPRDFYVRVFEEAKKAGLAIWVDEIQTFGRTGELFAYQKFQLNEWVDIVTIGKMLQACIVLFTDEYNPKPGLVAGTFAGSTTALRGARRIIEMLCHDGFLGPQGKIEELSSRFATNLEKLAVGPCTGLIYQIRAIGGMIAFVPLSGSMEDVKSVLMRLFDLGVVAFYCGHGPFLIRFLPPLGAMTEDDVDQVCKRVETALQEVANKKLLK